LNQNTQCQEISTSAPPSTGPSTRPTPATITLVPIAMPSCSRGNASVTKAEALANSSAPPTPWTMRHRIRSVPPVAKPAPSDATVKTAKPATNARLRPNRSLSRPNVSTSTVEAIMNARITHTNVSSPTPRAFSRSGSAITSVPELTVASSIPSDVQLSAHHL
jgi:hypothetical protein